MTDYANAFQAALQHHKAGQLAEAATLYEAALQARPDFTDALVNLAALRASQNDYGAAEECFAKALEIVPDDTIALINYGNLLLRRGDNVSALGNYRKAIAIAPQMEAAHLGLGNAHMQLGQFAEAVTAFQQALNITPKRAQTLQTLGVAYCRIGKNDLAVPAFRESLQLQPDNLVLQRDLAGALIDIGERDEPGALLQVYLNHKPDDPDAHYMAGNLAHFEHRLEDAITHYKVALENGGDLADNANNMANTLLELDRTDEALGILNKALEQIPDFATGWNSLGNIWLAESNYDEAASAYERALEIDPDMTVAANNLATNLVKAGRLQEALKVSRRNTEDFPKSPDTWTGLGTALLSLERFDEALEALEQALSINPDHLDARHNRAATLHRLERYGEALEDYQRLVALSPDRTQSWFNMGSLLQVLARHREAIETFEQVLKIDPDYNAAWSYLAHSLQQECRWEQLPEVRQTVIDRTRQELAEGSRISASPFSLLQLSAPGDVRLAAARQFAKAAAHEIGPATSQTAFRYAPPENGKLRIGYISPDFRGHSVGRMLHELLSAHDGAHFETFGYFTASGPDDVTARLVREFDHFVELDKVPFKDAARRINDDGIHILIDLAGHTRGSRFEILAQRPAPIQAHFLGYGFTVGADYIDYLITDAIKTPPSEREFVWENVACLPHHSLPASRPLISSVPVTRTDQGLPENAFVFANFNGHYKFDPDIFSIWMEILQAAPEAVLWLIDGKGDSPEFLRQRAHDHKIDPDRLIFAANCPNDEHLARLALADLALDTWHHSGGVTTIDALWAGLPVLTIATDDMVDRMGASLLGAAELPEMISTSLDDYKRRALSWVNAPETLANLKRKLKANQETAPLFDTPRMTRDLEALYKKMWDLYTCGEHPKVITLDD
jgi:protein O-GlcNAc transferase